VAIRSRNRDRVRTFLDPEAEENSRSSRPGKNRENPDNRKTSENEQKIEQTIRQNYTFLMSCKTFLF
jgi:hypothetical protein